MTIPEMLKVVVPDPDLWPYMKSAGFSGLSFGTLAHKQPSFIQFETFIWLQNNCKVVPTVMHKHKAVLCQNAFQVFYSNTIVLALGKCSMHFCVYNTRDNYKILVNNLNKKGSKCIENTTGKTFEALNFPYLSLNQPPGKARNDNVTTPRFDSFVPKLIKESFDKSP